MPPSTPLKHLAGLGHIPLNKGCDYVLENTNDVLQGRSSAGRLVVQAGHLEPLHQAFFLGEMDRSLRNGSHGLQGLDDQGAQVVLGRGLVDGSQKSKRMTPLANLPILRSRTCH